MPKLFSARLADGLFDEWVLVQEPPRTTAIAVAQVDPTSGKVKVSQKAPRDFNHAIVVAVGPGRQTPEGKLVPMDPRIKPGVTVVFPKNAERLLLPDYEKEMDEEGLYFMSASQFIGVLAPAGARSPAPLSPVRA